MNLNRRAPLLILPVIVAGYLIAATGAYLVQRDSILALEQTRLSLRVNEMAASFQNYSGFTANYLSAVTDSEILRNFVRETDDRYKNLFLRQRLERLQSRLRLTSSDFVSFAIIMRTGDVMYYYESSVDPFAEISALQLDISRTMFDNNVRSRTRHEADADHGSLLIYSRVLDSRTISEPLESQLDYGIVVQVAVAPTRFEELKSSLVSDYGARIHFVEDAAHSTALLSATAALADDYYLVVEADEAYLQQRLRQLKLLLLAAWLLVSVLSYILLLWLIRRQITLPISELELELNAVQRQEKRNISPSPRSDEIGRLSRTFHGLYQRLTESYAESRFKADHDDLTELPNRAHFTEFATRALEKARSDQVPVALLYMDLDNFKYVNDKFGHEVGDALLKAFSLRLAGIVRDTDVVFELPPEQNATTARLAGDEFAVLVRKFEDRDGPVKAAERILEMFDNGFTFDRGQYPVTASIGIAVFPEDASNYDELIANADAAMYQAKMAGKNRVASYSLDLAHKVRRAREIETELRRIDLDAELRLVYQPVHDVSAGAYRSCEALLRWRSPSIGDVGPHEFIPIAETSGNYKKIDFWVVGQALRDYPSLRAHFGVDFKLSVNLSSAELSDPQLEAFLVESCENSGVSPSSLILEITETFEFLDGVSANQLLVRLKQQGFGIAIDDFGTGYTSLLQMIEYPANIIKLDRQFINRLNELKNHNVLKPLINLFHSQKIRVTAEGVETAEVRQWLELAGCDSLQGYYFSKPVDLESLIGENDSSP